jgi:hypothetical protein
MNDQYEFNGMTWVLVFESFGNTKLQIIGSLDHQHVNAALQFVGMEGVRQ